MAVDVPNEIISKVYDDLTPNDLYTCLYINKQWGQNAARLLWETASLNPKKANTLISLIDKPLECKGLKLPEHNPSPMFPYPYFLTKFNASDLHKTLEEWLQHEEGLQDCILPFDEWFRLRYVLAESLLNLYRKYNATVQEIMLSNNRNILYTNDEYLITAMRENFNPLFIRAQKLYVKVITGTTIQKFYDSMREHCHSLTEIIIEEEWNNNKYDEWKETIAGLIKSQPNLKKFTYTTQPYNEGRYIRKMSKILLKYASSLQSLIFKEIMFQHKKEHKNPLEYFDQFHKLEYIEFNRCMHVKGQLASPFRKAIFPNLQKVEIIQCYDSDAIKEWAEEVNM